MAEVVWQARRVSDGVLVDVTGDTAGTPAGAPFPNPIEGGAGAGGVTVDNQVAAPAAVTTIIAPGADLATPGEATLPPGSLLTDPGALWEAEHEYVTGDRILVWDTVVFECDTDGLSGETEPEWDTVNNVGDGATQWDVLGELGELNNALMPMGLGLFTLTSPSAIITSIVIDGAVNPSDDAGVPAGEGTIYRYLSGGVGGLFVKVGVADTAWRELFTLAMTGAPVNPASPVIPASPDAQDIADALIALGLATQAV